METVFILLENKNAAYDIHSVHNTFDGAAAEAYESLGFSVEMQSSCLWVNPETMTAETLRFNEGSLVLTCSGGNGVRILCGYAVMWREVER